MDEPPKPSLKKRRASRAEPSAGEGQASRVTDADVTAELKRLREILGQYTPPELPPLTAEQIALIEAARARHEAVMEMMRGTNHVGPGPAADSGSTRGQPS